MTEKKRFELRFTGGDTFIIDNETHINHFIGFEDVTDDFKCIVGLLNELHEENEQLKSAYGEMEDYLARLEEENEQLKQRIQLLSSLLDIADAIIDLSDDDKSKSFWEKRNNEVEQKWEEIVKNGDFELIEHYNSEKPNKKGFIGNGRFG